MAAFYCRLPKRLYQPGSVHALKLFSTSSPVVTEDEVVFETHRNCGTITLNRPKVLNAMTLNMFQMMRPALKSMDDDCDINVIVIKGSGEKAFCAGGDVVAITSKGEPTEHSKLIFKEACQLHYEIANLRTPYIAMMHGITMGAGVGLSMHGRYRVATEETFLAMPETAIGFFTDAGAGYFLPRLPSNLGMFMALTGCHLKGWDSYCAGIATHFVASQEMPYLQEELINLQSPCSKTIDRLLDDYHRKSISASASFSLQKHLTTIESVFSAGSVEEIIERLEKDGSEWALKQLRIMKKRSPSSLKLTHRQLREGCTMNLKEMLEMEYRLSQGFLRNKDFYEGIRALLVDRDNTPVWSPNTLAEVTDEIMDSYFQPLGKNELILPDV